MDAGYWQKYEGVVVDRFETEEMVFNPDSAGLYDPKRNLFTWRDGRVYLGNTWEIAKAETLDDWQVWKAIKSDEDGIKVVNKGNL